MDKALHLSIVIPAYNEAARLPATVDAVLEAVAVWPHTTELILVDDGSTDATGRIISEIAAARDGVTPVILRDNRGKGGAIAAGVAASRGEFVLFFDADLSYPLEAVPDALGRLESGADVVIGARDLEPSNGRASYSPLRNATSLAFNAFVEVVLRLGIHDTQCGFKAFRGEVARELFPTLAVRGFGFDVELLFAARRRGCAIALMPIRMEDRAGSSVRVLRHGIQMARDVMRVRVRGWMGRYKKAPTR